jgi:VWFA-related protein
MSASMARLSIPRSGLFGLAAFAALLLAATGHPALAQATAAANTADAPSAQAEPLRTDVRRVNVDVVVTDSKGRPVIGLTRDDFKVKEDKVPQTVRFFDVHTVASAADFVAPRIPALPPNTFLNLAKAPEFGTPTVILYDALNTPLTEQAYGHKQILDLIRHRRPGTQIAIFVLTGKLHLLQGFTEDTDLLAAALASKKGSPQTTTLLRPSGDIAWTPMADNPPLGNEHDPDEVFNHFVDKARELDGRDQAQLQDHRVALTLHALTDIGRFLASLPGRKDLIWLSSAFPVGILPDSTITANSQQHDQSARNYSGLIEQAADLLNRSHVSVYPVDIRGLRVNSDLSAASNARYGPGGVFAAIGSPGATTFNNLSFSQRNFILRDLATRTTMDSIADATGGHAFYGTNDLKGAVDRALSSGSTYYSLTYEPTNSKYDSSLRHIKVTLRKSGYDLSYRKTYFADDLEAAAQKVADAPQNPLTPSLERGTPLAHGLFLEAQLEADGPPVPATPEQMEVLSQYGDPQTKKTKGKTVPTAPVLMQQYLISYGLIARQLEMPADDTGAHQASLELGLISYDEDGRKLNGLDTHIDDTIPAPRYAKLASDGYHVVQSVAVPVTASSIRLAVRDIRGNRVGSLEVQLPLAKTAEAKIAERKPLAK